MANFLTEERRIIEDVHLMITKSDRVFAGRRKEDIMADYKVSEELVNGK